jgi:hypothetical protein
VLAGDGWMVPRQLPGSVRHFVGRASELTALSCLRDGVGTGSATIISAVGGMAGVGKTALAMHWAHQVAGEFPDGQLYVNLRGYDAEQPMAAGDALAGWLPSCPRRPWPRCSRRRRGWVHPKLAAITVSSRHLIPVICVVARAGGPRADPSRAPGLSQHTVQRQPVQQASQHGVRTVPPRGHRRNGTAPWRRGAR